MSPGAGLALTGGTVARPHHKSGMLQAQTRHLVAPWHGHTVCLGCSMLSRVSPWHHGVSTLCVWDAPGSAVSLRGTVACPHSVSGMLQALTCPLVAPWHGHTVCLACSRLSRVSLWHRGMSTPCVWDAPGSATSLGGTTARPLRMSGSLLPCVSGQSTPALSGAAATSGTAGWPVAQGQRGTTCPSSRVHTGPMQPGGGRTDPFHVPAAGARQLFNFPGAGREGDGKFPGAAGAGAGTAARFLLRTGGQRGLATVPGVP